MVEVRKFLEKLFQNIEFFQNFKILLIKKAFDEIQGDEKEQEKNNHTNSARSNGSDSEEENSDQDHLEKLNILEGKDSKDNKDSKRDKESILNSLRESISESI